MKIYQTRIRAGIVNLQWFMLKSDAKKELKNYNIPTADYKNHLFEYDIDVSKNGILYFLNKHVR